MEIRNDTALLSRPLEMRRLRLRNRLVMAPMATCLAEGSSPSKAQIDWYALRAASGIGLVIVEAAAIERSAAILPRNLGIWEDAQVEGLARLAAAIRSGGARSAIQLVHGGARAWRDNLDIERMGPSAVPLMPGPVPRAMGEQDIAGVLAAFAAAARRAREAGFDAVEIHAAHYYLLSQFLSPYSNRREDRWGGNLEGRARLTAEAIRAARRTVGEDFPIFCRMNAVELFEGGLGTADAALAARMFRDAGADLIDASGIGQASWVEWEGGKFLSTSSALPKGAPPGVYAPHAGALRAGLGIPVIAVGKLGEPGAAEKALREGHCDLVALGRQLIADPESGRKLLEGRDGDIDRCTECLGCFASIRTGSIACPVNRDISPAG